jgi:hypothetical protein
MGIEIKPHSFVRLRLVITSFSGDLKEVTSVVECNVVVAEIDTCTSQFDAQGGNVPLVHVHSHGEVKVTQTVGGRIYDPHTREVRPI